MDKEIKDLKKADVEDAIRQSEAITKITRDLLETTQHALKRVYIILAISIIANLVIVGAFLWYESHMEWTETITQTVDGESSQIKNEEYNDRSVHNEGIEPETVDESK